MFLKVATPTPELQLSTVAVHLSVIIKAYNEQDNICRCIESVVAACKGLAVEIIVADGLSSDRTVELASAYSVVIVSLADARDRSCGSGAQLGYQFAAGRYILTLDADMVLRREFVMRALDELETKQGLAGVGGILCEKGGGLEFRLRSLRRDGGRSLGEVDYLNGSGCYDAAAIRDIGYLTNRNLHSCEEWELGTRLRLAGWRLRRLDCIAVEHYGDEIAWPNLLWHRWRSRYAQGYGELLKASWRRPYFLRAVRRSWKFIVVLACWLLTIAAFAGAGANDGLWLTGMLIFFAALFAILRKRSINAGLYSFALWNIHAAGLIAGALRPQVDPAARIAACVRSDRRVATISSRHAS